MIVSRWMLRRMFVKALDFMILEVKKGRIKFGLLVIYHHLRRHHRTREAVASPPVLPIVLTG